MQVGMVSKSPKSQVQSQRYRWKDTGGFCQNQGSAKHTAILVHDLNLLVVLHGARSEYRYCTEFNGQKIVPVPVLPGTFTDQYYLELLQTGYITSTGTTG